MFKAYRRTWGQSKGTKWRTLSLYSDPKLKIDTKFGINQMFSDLPPSTAMICPVT